MAVHNKESILKELTNLKVDHRVWEHEKVPTCDLHTAALKALGVKTDGQAKNLFFKVPSGGGKLKNRLFMVCALVDTVVDAKKVSARLGIKASSPLRFANTDLFEEVLKVPQGSVTVFCMANNTASQVTLLLDKRFKDVEGDLLFHPMTNEATVGLSAGGLQTLLDTVAKERSHWVDFDIADPIAIGEPSAPAPNSPKAKVNGVESPEAKKKEQPPQMFTADKYFTVTDWEKGPFADAQGRWLKTQS